VISLLLPAADDAAELVDALLTAADACEHRAPDLAARRRALAEDIGDALDNLPQPVTTEE
jgi:hypothetical protein